MYQEYILYAILLIVGKCQFKEMEVKNLKNEITVYLLKPLRNEALQGLEEKYPSMIHAKRISPTLISLCAVS